MTRQLARLVRVDAIDPIEGADAIEAARIGGWTVVVKKGEFRAGDPAVYFEIDTFLPEGNPAWQFLVDKAPRTYLGQRGHVLRSVRLRGQVSQGLLLGMQVLQAAGIAPERVALGEEVTQALGVTKYEPPVPAELAGIARGAFPSVVPKTDQQRVQNLATELASWQREALAFEVTEKLEGASCTFAWLEGRLHVCTRNVDLLEDATNSLWRLARELDIERKLAEAFAARNLALQGEVVGHGVQGNPYRLTGQAFYLYDVYDVDRGGYWSSGGRRELAERLAVAHVPVVDARFVLSPEHSTQVLLQMADGPSALRAEQLREGLVFKALHRPVSFKVVSNKYLLKHG